MSEPSTQSVEEFAKDAIKGEVAKWWPEKKTEINNQIRTSLDGVDADVRQRVKTTIQEIERSAKETVLSAVTVVEQRAFVIATTFIVALIAVTYMGARQAALTGQIEVQKELIALQKDLKAAREEADKATTEATKALRDSEDKLRSELEKIAAEKRKLIDLNGTAEALRKRLDDTAQSFSAKSK
jgi:hypothetical protein